MTLAPLPTVSASPVAHFPEGYFLENLAVRADDSVLVTAFVQKELWYVAPTAAGQVVDPILVHTFDHPISFVLEVEPDVFVVGVTEAYTTYEALLARIDLTDWTPGDPVEPTTVVTFTDPVQALNGACLLDDTTMAVADPFAGLVWRVDLGPHAHSATTRVWLAHDTMGDDPDGDVAPPRQPGVNGVHYSARTGYLYYTSTAQHVFMRVPVDPETLEPAGAPEFVAALTDADDFCLDEAGGFAYVTRHRANTLDRVPLTPRHGSEVRHLLGDPLDTVMVGPSSAAWGRRSDEAGTVVYVTTDGGRTASPDGVVRPAALLRVELTRPEQH